MIDVLNERRRLDALEGYRIIDTEPEQTFDDITAIAAHITGAPVALISLVTEDRQWFKSAVGFDATETPRDISVCTHVIAQDEPLYVVPDMAADPRFADGPLVNGPEKARFYAGAVLKTSDGDALGALCVLDTRPRPEGLSEPEQKALKSLARQVMSLLELRQMVAWRSERERQLRTLADSMPQMVWSTLPDGNHDYYNARWYEFTGVPPGSTDGEGWNGMFHPEDQARARAEWSNCLKTGEPYEIEYRLRHHSGEYRWTLGRAQAMRGPDGEIVRWFGTCTDIHDQKRLSDQESLLSRELSHRIKNIFSVISGLVALSARRFPEAKDFARDLRGRIVSLGRAHDFVRPYAAAGASSRPNLLAGLLEELLSPYQGEAADRITVNGDAIAIDDQVATPLALVFHELATNAAKYGAFSDPDGKVCVNIRTDADALIIDWIETDGPKIAGAPTIEGFGSTLAKLSVETQLGGRLERRWTGDGLQVTLSIPSKSLNRR